MDFLEGFSERMKLVGIVDSIVNRKRKNLEIEKWFQEHELTNIVMSVLLKIMDKTLTENKECSSRDIKHFLASILPHYKVALNDSQTESLTHYILKSILQNDGQASYFRSMDYGKGEAKEVAVRLIADRVREEDGRFHITYSLTDQGFDFIFRTKEVNQEIKMTIEELKLREFIKRKNFSNAQIQSQELIHLIRQQKKAIELFITKIKDNIYDADVGEFENLMDHTYDLLKGEYELLGEIMDMVQKSEEMIRHEFETTNHLDDRLRKAQSEIRQINFNIKSALSEQRGLILSRQNLSDLYIETISESFHYSMEKRFDLEEAILRPMEQHTGNVEKFWRLLNPLFLPNPYKHLNPSIVYEPQSLLKVVDEPDDEGVESEKLAEDKQQEKVERLSRAYVEIMDFLLVTLMELKGETTVDELLRKLEEKADNQLGRLMEERLFFTTLLKLYDIGTIDLEKWRGSRGGMFMNATEEFNLEYCLECLHEKSDRFGQLMKIELTKIPGEKINYEISRSMEEGLEFVEKFQITNLRVKAVMQNGEYENSGTDIQNPVRGGAIGQGNA
ncbi:hypothetical protein [Saccharococcus sp. Marseille-Q5394]|uniref:hypothetical protein n=1 Tax=Saccharococcus sp. Marseille-Q5394 TaxID=2972778 RepID=UPI0021C6D50F|nr:hypothetical protein [Saccharococcus sp. Marseille-Q5394]